MAKYIISYSMNYELTTVVVEDIDVVVEVVAVTVAALLLWMLMQQPYSL